jgi:GntR family transcriptional regulator / MocR family aminotransferase
MAPWELTVTLDRETSLPVFRQIARAITADITRGRLRPGTRLPGTRTLAHRLGVNRNTVLAAYQELIAEGWLMTSAASGTFISSRLPDEPPGSREQAVQDRNASAVTAFGVRPAPALPRPVMHPRGTLDISSGQPDLASVRSEELSRAYRRALRLGQRQLLGYCDPAGHPRLRDALAEMVSATRSLPADSGNILITSGSQMAWTLLGLSLLGPGDTIAVEALGYRPAWEAFRQTGARLSPVPVDDAGLRVNTLAKIACSERLRAVYITPHRQYPTTVTMSVERRMRLLDLAARHGFAIIEDDYDHEFHDKGRPIQPLASVDGYGSVVYVGTLSKIYAPGLRIGFVVAPASLVESLAARRMVLDLHGDHVVEAAVAELMRDGEIQRHVNRLGRHYAKRRTTLLGALKEHLPGVVYATESEGGLGVWCSVDEDVDVDAWAGRALRHGVAFHTGRRYAFSGESLPNIRLSFAPLNETEILEAIRRMAAALPARRCRAAHAYLPGTAHLTGRAVPAQITGGPRGSAHRRVRQPVRTGPVPGSLGQIADRGQPRDH